MKFTLPCLVFVAGGAFASPVPDTDASTDINSGNVEAEAPPISLPPLPFATPAVDIADTLDALGLDEPVSQSTPNAPALNITDTLNSLGLLKPEVLPTTPSPATSVVNTTNTLLGLLKPATPAVNLTDVLSGLLQSATPVGSITDLISGLLKPPTPPINITDILSGLLKPVAPALNITSILSGLLKPVTPPTTTIPPLNVTQILSSLGLLKPAAPQQCTKPNQVYNGCGTSCPAKCWQLTPQICNKLCKVGCQCKPGFLLNKAGDCVSPFNCIFDLFSL